MSFANNHGTKIHYDVEGWADGPTVLLVHGLTASRQGWYDFGYVDALKPDYRVLVMEQRGHGQSDKPHTVEAYGRDQVVGDVLAVLDDAGADRAIYWGYSLGAHTGFATALSHAGRFDAFVLGGMHPYRRTPAAGGPSRANLFRQGMAAYAKAVTEPQNGGALPPDRLARLLANDAEALACFTDALPTWGVTEEVLGRFTQPVLLYAGTADHFHEGAQRAAAEIPGAHFVSLPGLTHGQASSRGDLVLPHVLPFLAQVARAAGSPA